MTGSTTTAGGGSETVLVDLLQPARASQAIAVSSANLKARLRCMKCPDPGSSAHSQWCLISPNARKKLTRSFHVETQTNNARCFKRPIAGRFASKKILDSHDFISFPIARLVKGKKNTLTDARQVTNCGEWSCGYWRLL